MDCTPLFKKVSGASRSLLMLGEAVISNALRMLADDLIAGIPEILAENKKDLDRMVKSDPRWDRLLLTPDRIRSIAEVMRDVASMPDPTGRQLSNTKRPNGLVISRITVPFGVIGIIFEARPNVVLDVFALCLKSRNACILKGGSDAKDSNKILVNMIGSALERSGIDKNIIALLPPGRNETSQMLKARDYIDLVIPRGSRGLIDFVRENSTIPVIETGAGICHTYFDRSGDRDKGRTIVNNAKTRRVSVCNALDCLIIHSGRLGDLDHIVGLCADSGVVIHADKQSFKALKSKYPDDLLLQATKDSFGTEFLSYTMAVKTVNSIEEALGHISKYSSRHSEAIIAEDKKAIDLFLNIVDASSVFSNASTAFTDGSEFGLGAEIGISTQKLHARGPMALEELTTYKWIIKGDGQIRK